MPSAKPASPRLGSTPFADLKSFRRDPDRMRQLAISLCATAAVMLTITAHTMSFQDELLMEKARADANQQRAELASHLNALVAACMNNRQWIYVDPHTGADIAIFCHKVVLGRIGR